MILLYYFNEKERDVRLFYTIFFFTDRQTEIPFTGIWWSWMGSFCYSSNKRVVLFLYWLLTPIRFHSIELWVDSQYALENIFIVILLLLGVIFECLKSSLLLLLLILKNLLTYIFLLVIEIFRILWNYMNYSNNNGKYK